MVPSFEPSLYMWYYSSPAPLFQDAFGIRCYFPKHSETYCSSPPKSSLIKFAESLQEMINYYTVSKCPPPPPYWPEQSFLQFLRQVIPALPVKS